MGGREGVEEEFPLNVCFCSSRQDFFSMTPVTNVLRNLKTMNLRLLIWRDSATYSHQTLTISLSLPPSLFPPTAATSPSIRPPPFPPPSSTSLAASTPPAIPFPPPSSRTPFASTSPPSRNGQRKTPRSLVLGPMRGWGMARSTRWWWVALRALLGIRTIGC